MTKPIDLTVAEQVQTIRWFAKTIGQLTIVNGVDAVPSAAAQEALLAGANALEKTEQSALIDGDMLVRYFRDRHQSLTAREIEDAIKELEQSKPSDVIARKLLHDLWTKAVGTPGYNKSEWLQLEQVVLGARSQEKP